MRIGTFFIQKDEAKKADLNFPIEIILFLSLFATCFHYDKLSRWRNFIGRKRDEMKGENSVH